MRLCCVRTSNIRGSALSTRASGSGGFPGHVRSRDDWPSTSDPLIEDRYARMIAIERVAHIASDLLRMMPQVNHAIHHCVHYLCACYVPVVVFVEALFYPIGRTSTHHPKSSDED
mmetsp:Transcript_22631/g.33816  ORF Transcript_22631/g.33816 Transcript_22631/m.33816 type:complete len:115 (+) Transcript_22631:386-730(+)